FRIAGSPTGAEATVSAERLRCRQATQCTTAYTAASPSNDSVTPTSTCLATSTASGGVASAAAAAIRVPSSAHNEMATDGERLNEATRAVSPGWCTRETGASAGTERALRTRGGAGPGPVE